MIIKIIFLMFTLNSVLTALAPRHDFPDLDSPKDAFQQNVWAHFHDTFDANSTPPRINYNRSYIQAIEEISLVYIQTFFPHMALHNLSQEFEDNFDATPLKTFLYSDENIDVLWYFSALKEWEEKETFLRSPRSHREGKPSIAYYRPDKILQDIKSFIFSKIGKKPVSKPYRHYNSPHDVAQKYPDIPLSQEFIELFDKNTLPLENIYETLRQTPPDMPFETDLTNLWDEKTISMFEAFFLEFQRLKQLKILEGHRATLTAHLKQTERHLTQLIASEQKSLKMTRKIQRTLDQESAQHNARQELLTASKIYEDQLDAIKYLKTILSQKKALEEIQNQLQEYAKDPQHNARKIKKLKMILTEREAEEEIRQQLQKTLKRKENQEQKIKMLTSLATQKSAITEEIRRQIREIYESQSYQDKLHEVQELTDILKPLNKKNAKLQKRIEELSKDPQNNAREIEELTAILANTLTKEELQQHIQKEAENKIRQQIQELSLNPTTSTSEIKRLQAILNKKTATEEIQRQFKNASHSLENDRTELIRLQNALDNNLAEKELQKQLEFYKNTTELKDQDPANSHVKALFLSQTATLKSLSRDIENIKSHPLAFEGYQFFLCFYHIIIKTWGRNFFLDHHHDDVYLRQLLAHQFGDENDFKDGQTDLTPQRFLFVQEKPLSPFLILDFGFTHKNKLTFSFEYRPPLPESAFDRDHYLTETPSYVSVEDSLYITETKPHDRSQPSKKPSKNPLNLLKFRPRHHTKHPEKISSPEHPIHPDSPISENASSSVPPELPSGHHSDDFRYTWIIPAQSPSQRKALDLPSHLLHHPLIQDCPLRLFISKYEDILKKFPFRKQAPLHNYSLSFTKVLKEIHQIFMFLDTEKRAETPYSLRIFHPQIPPQFVKNMEYLFAFLNSQMDLFLKAFEQKEVKEMKNISPLLISAVFSFYAHFRILRKVSQTKLYHSHAPLAPRTHSPTLPTTTAAPPKPARSQKERLARKEQQQAPVIYADITKLSPQPPAPSTPHATTPHHTPTLPMTGQYVEIDWLTPPPFSFPDPQNPAIPSSEKHQNTREHAHSDGKEHQPLSTTLTSTEQPTLSSPLLQTQISTPPQPTPPPRKLKNRPPSPDETPSTPPKVPPRLKRKHHLKPNMQQKTPDSPQPKTEPEQLTQHAHNEEQLSLQKETQPETMQPQIIELHISEDKHSESPVPPQSETKIKRLSLQKETQPETMQPQITELHPSENKHSESPVSSQPETKIERLSLQKETQPETMQPQITELHISEDKHHESPVSPPQPETKPEQLTLHAHNEEQLSSQKETQPETHTMQPQITELHISKDKHHESPVSSQPQTKPEQLTLHAHNEEQLSSQKETQPETMQPSSPPTKPLRRRKTFPATSPLSLSSSSGSEQLSIHLKPLQSPLHSDSDLHKENNSRPALTPPSEDEHPEFPTSPQPETSHEQPTPLADNAPKNSSQKTTKQHLTKEVQQDRPASPQKQPSKETEPLSKNVESPSHIPSGKIPVQTKTKRKHRHFNQVQTPPGSPSLQKRAPKLRKPGSMFLRKKPLLSA